MYSKFQCCFTAKAALKFGTEAWVLKKREEQRLEAAQMKFLRHLLGITKLDKEKNQCIRQKMGVQNTVKEMKQYHKKWLQHVQRMDTSRLPKQALQYKPKGRRNIGRPRKRWRDQLHLEDQGTGNTPNPSGTCDDDIPNVWLTVHRNSVWIRNHLDVTFLCYPLFLLYKLLSMFRATMCPSSGADDCVVLSPRVDVP